MLKFHHSNRLPTSITFISQRLTSSTTNKENTQNKDHILKRFHRTVERYHHLPYEEQLKKKQWLAEESMRKLANIMKYNKGVMTARMREQADRYGGYACIVDGIRPSPVIKDYRNKDNFTVDVGYDGRPKAVGFYIKRIREKGHCIVNEKLISQRENHHELSKVYESFLYESPLGICPSVQGPGHWRNFLVRSNLMGQTMVCVGFHPQKAEMTLINSAKESLLEYFLSGPGKNLPIDSLYFHQNIYHKHSKLSGVHELLHGEPHIHESLSDYKFRISPDSFFQLNTLAAEVLYDTVREHANLDKDTLLLDVCCGTGTIGIVLSKYVKKVVGLEVVQQAVEDAKSNAQLNGVENAMFHYGKAEKDLKTIIADNTADNGSTNVVAVVNPGRGGLGAKVMRAIRRCEAIRKVIYISCKPEGRCCYNFLELCQEEGDKYPAQPFLPTKATPVDMFPQTQHYDLVISFER